MTGTFGQNLSKPGHTILLAEDDIDDLEVIMSAFSKLNPGNKFEIATNGAEAIVLLNHLASTKLPCLIIMDLNMPVLDGISTLRAIRDDDRLKKIPTVIYTTSSLSTDRYECLELGAADYIVKPDNFAGVIESASKMLDYCH